MKILIHKFLKRVIHFYFDVKWNAYIEKRNKLKSTPVSKPVLFFGTQPILNFSYWSAIMNKLGYMSRSFSIKVASINKESDFDVLISRDESVRNLIGTKMSGYLFFLLKEYLLFDYVLKNFDIFHISYDGLSILPKKYWKYEMEMLKKKGAKIVVMPYGSDCVQFSKYSNAQSFKHGYLIHYPNLIRSEPGIRRRMEFINFHADLILGGANTIGKVWNLLACNYLTISMEKFKPSSARTFHDGKNGVVKIVHSPNHRYLKGTEFLIKAVEDLKNEGLLVELVLLENIKNDQVIHILCEEGHILVEQLLSGYALSAIEGMASGLPVLSNLDDVEYDKRPYRRFSYLNECPILSANPENVKENLKLLVRNPELRKELGTAGRKYAEKYHSDKTAEFMFNLIYDHIWYQKPGLHPGSAFHPLDPRSYNNQSPVINHPLSENKIPSEVLSGLNQ